MALRPTVSHGLRLSVKSLSFYVCYWFALIANLSQKIEKLLIRWLGCQLKGPIALRPTVSNGLPLS